MAWFVALLLGFLLLAFSGAHRSFNCKPSARALNPFPSRIEGKKEGKRAALDAERAQRAARKRKRDEGIAMLKKHNIFVDSLPGEFDNETDSEADMWGSRALRTLLARGPAFKVVPAF